MEVTLIYLSPLVPLLRHPRKLTQEGLIRQEGLMVHRRLLARAQRRRLRALALRRPLEVRLVSPRSFARRFHV